MEWYLTKGKMMLKKMGVLLLALGLLTNFANGHADSTNEVISSHQGNFTIDLPKGFQKPEYTMTPVKTEVGEIKTLNYISYADTGACMVGMSEYPPQLVALIDQKQDEVLKGAQEGALRNMGAKVINESSLTVDKLSAREATFVSSTDAQPLYGKMRLISSMPRLYHILYLTDKEENLNNPEVDSFFGSFKIL
ncbi:MAG: hypothetical protein JHC93_02930 [Parachlamydiales bacterium]|nr:hypothetical protein [Parachlamydiales bacterium]